MSIRLSMLAGAGALALAALAGGSSLAQGAHPPLDPKCLKDVPWEVDASGPLQVYGCRPAADVPAPDAQGWVEYDRGQVDGSDGGFIRAKLVSISPQGVWTFKVQDNGGGSGTFPYTVTGTPGADGVLIPALGVKVTPEPAS